MQRNMAAEGFVDVSRMLRPAERRVIGINVNYLNDGASIARAKRPLEQALRQMGIASIRFPGGDKSDNYLWSAPPYERPQPHLAMKTRRLTPAGMREFVEQDGITFRHKPLDFDDFMGMCRRLGAEPTVVVPYDCLHVPAEDSSSPPSLDSLIENAAQWVRYANIVRGYGVRYWEIGNESYLSKKLISASAYAEHLPMFARAMKRMDPSILIGANGPNSPDDPGKFDEAGGDQTPWWKAVLERGAAEIDFLALHSYPCWRWRKYEHWLKNEQSLPADMAGGFSALQRWAPDHAGRIRTAITEANSADWSSTLDDKKGWPHLNNLGHALVLGDMLGSALILPYVDMLCVWNTRWINDGRRGSLWDTLDPDNGLAPTGEILAAWGNNLLDEMVAAEAGGPVRIYACASFSRARLSIFLINKAADAISISLICKGGKLRYGGSLHRFTGAGPDDPAPGWMPSAPLLDAAGRLAFSLPPHSFSVASLAAG